LPGYNINATGFVGTVNNCKKAKQVNRTKYENLFGEYIFKTALLKMNDGMQAKADQNDLAVKKIKR
jgi:hypothetical protein